MRIIWVNVAFHAKTGEYYREHFELPFLKHFLKPDEAEADKAEKSAGDAKAEKFNLAEANVFETGTNQWRHFDAWPPKEATEKSLYLHAGGRLSFDAPGDNEGARIRRICKRSCQTCSVHWLHFAGADCGIHDR